MQEVPADRAAAPALSRDPGTPPGTRRPIRLAPCRASAGSKRSDACSARRGRPMLTDLRQGMRLPARGRCGAGRVRWGGVREPSTPFARVCGLRKSFSTSQSARRPASRRRTIGPGVPAYTIPSTGREGWTSRASYLRIVACSVSTRYFRCAVISCSTDTPGGKSTALKSRLIQPS